MAYKRYTLTGTAGNDNKAIYEPDRINQWVYTWDGLAGTDALFFDRLQQKEFKIYKSADGAVHVDSVSGASHMIYVTLTNVEKLYFYYNSQVVNLLTYFNNAPTGSVTISGTAAQGSVLTATQTLADADTIATAINWQWKANGVAIAGATALTFSPTQSEVGKAITVVASYTDGGGSVESISSAATTAIVNVNDAPGGSVVISGTPTQGQILTATSTLTDLDGIPASGSGAIAYQWLADAQLIVAATGKTLTLTQAQVGKAISVRAAYTDLLGSTESVMSAATRAVANVNDAPSAQPASISLGEDSVRTGSLSATDIDGDSLKFSRVSGPAHGSVSINADGSFSYAPNSDFNGTDSFTFKVNDGLLDSVSATVSVLVTPVNDPPVNHLPAQPLAATEGVAKAITGLSISDVDTDAGSIAVSLSVAHGSLSFKAITGVTVSGNGTSSIKLSGPISAVNNALAASDGLVYQSSVGHTGSDTLTISTTEIRAGVTTGLLGDTDVIDITLRPSAEATTDSVVIVGRTGQGLILHANVGPLSSLGGQTPASADLHFDWLSGDAPIAGAHTSDLLLAASETGKMVSVKVSFKDSQGVDHSLVSAAVGPIQSASLQLSVQYRDSGTPLPGASANLYDTTPGIAAAPVASGSTDATGKWFDSALDFDTLLLKLGRASSSADTAYVTASDALAALELAFGRNPNPDPDGPGPLSPPPVSPVQLVAADITRDGRVTIADSAAIARIVQSPSQSPPASWVFADSNLDLSGASRASVPAAQPSVIDVVPGSVSDWMGVLLGDVDGNWRAV